MTKTRWTVNDLEYMEAPGLSMLVFHDVYPEGKQGGLEIIQHGERVATNGDLRLEPTPGQWAPLPKVGKRETDAEKGIVEVSQSYPDYNLDYTVRVQADGDSLRICVDLDRPLPPELVGKASFNLELFPQAYFGKTFHMGNTCDVFPRQANGPMMPGPEGQPIPAPLATGNRLYIAPEDPLLRMTIEQVRGGEMALFDGRDTAENGWFVVRSVVPSDATKGAIEWLVTPHSIPGWRRKPVISISQV
ncbi:MAG: glycoside hydrolase, partial [Candidatus Bathyarchaeia archaeon]